MASPTSDRDLSPTSTTMGTHSELPELAAMATTTLARTATMSRAKSAQRDTRQARADGTEIGLGGMTQTDLLKNILEPDNQVTYSLTPMHVAAGVGDEIALQNLVRHGATTGLHIEYPDAVNRTALFFAVLADSKYCAEILIQAGANVNHTDADGRTVGHWACYHGRDRLLKLFLQAGLDVGIPDKEGRTCMHWATACNSTKPLELVVKDALSKHISIDSTDEERMTPLHWAAFHDRPKHLQLLAKAGASLHASDIEGKNALHWTCGNANNAAAKTLLAMPGIKDVINSTDHEGRSALHMCVAESATNVLAILVKSAGININAQDSTGRTPLHWAAAIGSATMVQSLIRANANDSLLDRNGASSLHYAAQHGRLDCIAALLAGKLKSDVPDTEGRHALSWAVMKGNADACEALLKGGVNANKQDKQGRTALHVAAYVGNDKCVTILLKYKASVTLEDSAKQTALFPACEQGHLIAAKALVDAGSNANKCDVENRTPLHWAAISGRLDVVTMLTKNGATVDALDQRGETSLHYASFFGHVECVRTLLQANSNPNSTDYDGVSALHWAALQGHAKVVELLLERNAYPNFMEINGNKSTPLDYAYVGGHEDCIELLLSGGAYGSEGLMDLAALKIQTCFRGHLARKQLKLLKQAKLRREQEYAAATVLQKFARGFLQRRLSQARQAELAAERQRMLDEIARRSVEEQQRLDEEKRLLDEAKRRTEEEQQAYEQAMQMQLDAKKREEMEEAERLRLLNEKIERANRAREEARRAKEEEESKRRENERLRLEEKRKRMEDEQRRRIEEEAHKAEQIMHVKIHQQMRSFMVKAEQTRLTQVRQHIAAARIIQRAWRAYKNRQRIRARLARRVAAGAPASSSPQPTQRRVLSYSLVYVPVPDPLQERRRVVAALIIQLWWRRLMTQRALSERLSPSRLHRPSAPPRRTPDRSLVKLQRVRMQQIYSDPRPASNSYVPAPPRRQRSHYDYTGPTPARVSMTTASEVYLDSVSYPSTASRPSAPARRASLGPLKSTPHRSASHSRSPQGTLSLQARPVASAGGPDSSPNGGMRRTSSLPMLQRSAHTGHTTTTTTGSPADSNGTTLVIPSHPSRTHGAPARGPASSVHLPSIVRA